MPLKKPIVPSDRELKENPPSRSAKLRYLIKHEDDYEIESDSNEIFMPPLCSNNKCVNLNENIPKSEKSVYQYIKKPIKTSLDESWKWTFTKL